MTKKATNQHSTRDTKLLILQQATSMSTKRHPKAASWTITTPATMTSNQEKKNTEREENDKERGPPKEVIATPSSKESQTSSIGIGEYGMKAAKEGNVATFAWVVKFKLFKNVKFLQGADVSLDFSMNATTICGFMRIQCGVSECDAYQWWEEHRMLLRGYLTES